MKSTHIVFAATFLGLASISSAQWTVNLLKPAGTTNSAVYGVGASAQGGSANFGGGNPRATIWNGTAASAVNVNPAGSTNSVIKAVAGGKYAGWAVFGAGANANAGIWTGPSAASFVNLHPAGYSMSSITDAYGNQQVGNAQLGSSLRAGLWTGTAATFVDLTPAGASDAQVNGVGPNQQVGSFAGPTFARAALWSGTATSVVDLDNGAFAGGSYANDTDGTYQVGVVSFGAEGKAAMWQGSAASFTLLAPAGSWMSEARQVASGYQVGTIWDAVTFKRHATLWNGSASSAFDLGTLLPANYSHSDAYSIFISGNTMFVGGYAVNTTTNQAEAILWSQTMPVPEPGTIIALTLGSAALLRRRRK